MQTAVLDMMMGSLLRWTRITRLDRQCTTSRLFRIRRFCASFASASSHGDSEKTVEKWLSANPLLQNLSAKDVRDCFALKAIPAANVALDKEVLMKTVLKKGHYYPPIHHLKGMSQAAEFGKMAILSSIVMQIYKHLPNLPYPHVRPVRDAMYNSMVQLASENLPQAFQISCDGLPYAVPVTALSEENIAQANRIVVDSLIGCLTEEASISATETTLRSLSLLPDLTSQSAKESVVIPAINLDTPDPHKQLMYVCLRLRCPPFKFRVRKHHPHGRKYKPWTECELLISGQPIASGAGGSVSAARAQARRNALLGVFLSNQPMAYNASALSRDLYPVLDQQPPSR